MQKTYKFQPEQFTGMLSMREDLMAFYEALEAYKEDKNFLNRILLKDKIEDIELTLKHRTLSGMLNPGLAGEIDRYIGELVYDA